MSQDCIPQSLKSELLGPVTTSKVCKSGPRTYLPPKVWAPEEDRKLVHLRSKGWEWPAISRMLPGRSQSSCRLRYKCHLNQSPQWTEDRKDALSREYARLVSVIVFVIEYFVLELSSFIRLREHVWSMIGEKSGIPWRAAEAMHWHLGEQEIARRAAMTSCNIKFTEEPRDPGVEDQTARISSPQGEEGMAQKTRAIILPSIATLFPDIPKCQWAIARSNAAGNIVLR